MNTEQLLQENASLKQQITELHERMKAQDKQTKQALRERVKELNCLLGLSQLSQENHLTVEQFLQETARLIPPAWQFPELTSAQITFDDFVCSTSDFNHDSARLSESIRIEGKVRGSIDVACVSLEPGNTRKSIFLKEEEKLLKAIAVILSQYIERKETDIKRQETEEKLKADRERFSTLFYDAPLGMLFYDENGVILDCNKKFAIVIGVEPSKLIGFDMSRQLENKAVKQEMRNALKKGEGYYEGNYTSVLAKKTTFVRILFKGLRAQNGKIYGGLGMVEDITSRKNAEQELRCLKENLEQQVEAKTKELQERVEELERYHEAFVQREYRVKELKDEIASLKTQIDNPKSSL